MGFYAQEPDDSGRHRIIHSDCRLFPLLVQEGKRYSNRFSTAPPCSPANLKDGQHPHPGLYSPCSSSDSRPFPEPGFFGLAFWGALPLVIVMGVLSGVLLGTPVLKMRGDYLAIATLGFGEIIRILVLSDFLRPWLGGAQGIGKIPKAFIGGFEFAGPQQIYYLILAGCLLVIFISLRLRDSRLGRAWMAVREDEDVAQAMGINLVATKLLAFATGAGFSP